MKTTLLAILVFLILLYPQKETIAKSSHYPGDSRALSPIRLVKLPVGAVKPQGWLKNQLQAQAAGLTGRLDEFWPDIVNSAWKGAEGGDAWERTPYYLDGLVPLAYILDDSTLQAKAQPFIEWILASGRPDGWFGPGKHWQTWPLSVAGKVLTGYYEATQDERAIVLLANYFHCIAENKPEFPDKDWRGMRAMEHAVIGHWLYRRTHDPVILQAVEHIFRNSYDWTSYYEQFPWDAEAVTHKRIPLNWGADGLTAHVVNNAMAFKYPGLWYVQSGDERYKNAVYTALQKYDAEHGQVGGRFSGDEHLSGKRPTQGTELCAVVESMFSLEKLIEIFGDVRFADRLELLAYNSLPGTMTPDVWAHQYDQQANQVLCTVAERDWSSNGDYSNIYGLMPNYPCCLANFHQGWPKFVEHLWFATPDSGLAAAAYGPSVVAARVGDDIEAVIHLQTDYPFSDTLQFKISLSKSGDFPLTFRIPLWAERTAFTVNGDKAATTLNDHWLTCRRTWRDGDIVTLVIAEDFTAERRYNDAVAIRRGPLYFALRIEKEFKRIHFQKKNYYSIDYLGSADWEIRPTSDWNYGLAIDSENPGQDIKTDRFPIHEYPFGDRGDMVYWDTWDTFVSWQHEAPIVLRLPAKKIPSWGLKNNSADDPPLNPVAEGDIETVDLVPYGCARLRISEFPLVNNRPRIDTN